MALKPVTTEAVQLLMEGAVCMANIERVGLRIDLAYLDRSIAEVSTRISDMEKSLRASKEYRLWAKHFGGKMTLGSRPQLGHVVFDLLGHERNPHMKDLKNDVGAFEHLNLQFTKDYFGIERMKKALNTYLYGIRREVVGDYIHPFFDLHTAESYRSSSSKFNFHNLPVRNKEISKIIRTCVVPRKDRVFVEADYGSQEVRVSACYNKDPKLISYITGGGDMHRDMAMKIYMLDEEPSKETRYAAKNKFVFPQFYGSVYAQCAPNLWDAIDQLNLKRADGVSLHSHLRSKGIRTLGACDFEQSPVAGSFEQRVQHVEREMWEDVFTVYNQWKKDWWALYQSQGGVNSLTGFRQEGIFRRNQILADVIQGSAFHCLLWSAIHIQRELRRRKMKSLLVCQVHDSLLVDAPESEVPDLVALIKEYAVEKIAKHWKWIIVPLAIEFEVARESWASKVPMGVIV